MSLDGTVYVVRLLKVHASEISLSDDGKLKWPRLANDSPALVDGVLLLHDASRPTTRLETLRIIGLYRYFQDAIASAN
jgi:hypothetical protein